MSNVASRSTENGVLDREETRLLRAYQEPERRAVVKGFETEFDMSVSQAYERRILRGLKRHDLLPLCDKRVVDFGCGCGARLRDLMRMGAAPENLYGVDLVPERIDLCRQLSPNFHVSLGNAAQTAFERGQFDVALNFTMMSSVLDDDVARLIAAEMDRVVKPNGIILWYDLRYQNPWNPNVRPYSTRAIRRLFPDWRVRAKSLTLPPQLSRVLNKCPGSYGLLHLVPLFRISLFAVLSRR
ncbi:MAG: class I SAM-dependent methyltransferase [Pirellulaceae bacterium]|jgi:2-polyprenyl-3-methyl-5-hydroxy-6-metoxy-1,4-benzoquinol methylase|nr:class I SAM-dependent methyltransferase [Pirellulaceae bacterium]MDP7019372.1 class I SAM-dependent methyltransferase [Pirellulaceae bacterium]